MKVNTKIPLVDKYIVESTKIKSYTDIHKVGVWLASENELYPEDRLLFTYQFKPLLLKKDYDRLKKIHKGVPVLKDVFGAMSHLYISMYSNCIKWYHNNIVNDSFDFKRHYDIYKKVKNSPDACPILDQVSSKTIHQTNFYSAFNDIIYFAKGSSIKDINYLLYQITPEQIKQPGASLPQLLKNSQPSELAKKLLTTVYNTAYHRFLKFFTAQIKKRGPEYSTFINEYQRQEFLFESGAKNDKTPIADDLNNGYAYELKNASVVFNECYNILRVHGFLHQSVSLNKFKSLFLKKSSNKNSFIEWSGSWRELSFFVNILCKGSQKKSAVCKQEKSIYAVASNRFTKDGQSKTRKHFENNFRSIPHDRLELLVTAAAKLG